MFYRRTAFVMTGFAAWTAVLGMATSGNAQELTAGLWVGSVQVDRVSDGTVNGQPLRPVSRPFTFRILIDARPKTAGSNELTVRLLKDAIILKQAEDQRAAANQGQRFTDSELEVVLKPGRQTGWEPTKLRFSAVAYDFDGDAVASAPENTNQTMAAGTYRFAFTLPASYRTNPFRHKFHPEHRKGYQITRIFTLKTTGLADGVASGQFGEVITGLRKFPLSLAGIFRVQRVVELSRPPAASDQLAVAQASSPQNNMQASTSTTTPSTTTPSTTTPSTTTPSTTTPSTTTPSTTTPSTTTPSTTTPSTTTPSTTTPSTTTPSTTTPSTTTPSTTTPSTTTPSTTTPSTTTPSTTTPSTTTPSTTTPSTTTPSTTTPSTTTPSTTTPSTSKPTGTVGFAQATQQLNMWSDYAALGDIDGDGDLDFVVPSYRNEDGTFYWGDTVTLMINKGAAAFEKQKIAVDTASGTDAVDSPNPDPFVWSEYCQRVPVYVGDVTGDDRADVVWLRKGQTQTMLGVAAQLALDANTGALTFTDGKTEYLKKDIALWDVYAHGSTADIGLWRTAGTPSFNPLLVSLNDNNGVVYQDPIGFTASKDSRNVLLYRDFDGDGDADAFVGGSTGGIYYHQNNNTFADWTSHDISYSITSAAVGNVDGDSILDLLVSGSSGTKLYRNFGSDSSLPSAVDLAPDDDANDDDNVDFVAVTDMDSDGQDDLVVRVGDKLRWATYTSGETPIFKDLLTSGARGRQIHLRDIDGDGNIDVFTTSRINGDKIWLRN